LEENCHMYQPSSAPYCKNMLLTAGFQKKVKGDGSRYS
jgi:hypothetical protein